MAFFKDLFGTKKSEEQLPKFEINEDGSGKITRKSVFNFAKKVLNSLHSAKNSQLNDEQKAILEGLQHQLKQELKELEKEGNNAEKHLQEMAHEIFIMACASEIRMEEIAQFFADCGLNVESLNKFNKSGKLNALAAALVGKRSKKFLKWLIALGANVNFQSPDGNNLAHFAASIDADVETMEFLIKECGVDINAVNNDGMTALDIALMRIDRELAACLKDNGGKTNFKSAAFEESKKSQQNSSDKKTETEVEVNKEEMLYHAVVKGDVASVNSLILDGANVNSVQHGETILQTAARAGNWAITEKIADRASVITKENVRGISDALGQMIDNAGSAQTHVNNPFHHGQHNHHADDVKSYNSSNSGGMGR